MTWPTRTLLCIIVSLFAMSCKSTLGSYGAQCTAVASSSHASADQVPADDWMRLLLDDRQGREDCMGQPLTPVELPRRCAVVPSPGRPTALRLRSDKVVVHEASSDFALVWLPVEQFPKGQQAGLVGLVHASEDELTAVGVGTVRLPAEQVTLRLHQIRGDDILFAEGTACPGRGPAGSCERILKLLLLHDGRFVSMEMRNGQSQCTGPAEVPLAMSQDMRLDDGTIRRFELTATYSVTEDGLSVGEQLVTTDRTKTAEGEKASVFRKSDGSRSLEFTGAYFISDRESLWAGTREARGELVPDQPARSVR